MRLLVLETLERLRDRIVKMRDQSKAKPAEYAALEAERRALNIVMHFWEHQCPLTVEGQEFWGPIGTINGGQHTRSGQDATGS